MVLSLNPLPSRVISDMTRAYYASGEALRGLGDRSRATTVGLWIRTTEIRPTLITARRRAPARQPGTAPMSTVRKRPVNKAWSGYGRVSLRVFARGLAVSSHARYVISVIVYDYCKPRFIERLIFLLYFLPLLEVIAEGLLATCLSRTVTPDGASHSDRRPNRAAALSSTTTVINFERSAQRSLVVGPDSGFRPPVRPISAGTHIDARACFG